MSEACWFNRFHPTEPRCTKPGVWRKPEAISDFSRATRWCDEHRHDDDVPVVVDGRCESCWREAESRYSNGYGPYESLVAAYYAVMHEREDEHAPCTRPADERARAEARSADRIRAALEPKP